MKPSHEKSFHCPFSRLKKLVEKKKLNLAPCPESRPGRHPRLSKQEEDALFTQAMGDVAPLSHNRHWQLPDPQPVFQAIQNREEEETVAALHRLIQTGQGFVISQTDEYMEACRPGVDPRIIRQLHQGRYAIQDYIDLHGLLAREAEQILHGFIKRSILRGCQAVLIIHGRGLKSPGKPVLKAKVFNWLTRGPLRSHVVALASARACDGGAGATYALLRQRPIKRSRYRRTKTAKQRNSPKD